MNHSRHRWHRVLLCCTLLSLLPQLLAWPLHAQENRQPTVQITNVETSQFPLLQVTIAGTTGPAPLAELPLALTVDGYALPVLADETIQQGLQLALAVDVNNLFNRGQSGQSGYIEMVGTVRSLVESGSLVRNQDWLAAYLLQGETAPQPVQAWTQEPNLIFNSLVGNRPPEIVDSPLSVATLSTLMTQFADEPGASALPKALLLFSAGGLLGDVDTLVAQAQTQTLTVHVVALLGAQGTTTATDPLQQLATATGGHYVALTNPDMTAPLVEQLANAHTARRVQVRADTATIQSLAVTVTLPDGNVLTDSVDSSAFAAVAVTAPEITITTPSGPEINWSELAPAPDNSAEHLLPVVATFAWPNNQARQLVQVTYTLRGPDGFARQEIRTAAPFDQATLALPAPGNAAAGAEYTLEVMALDELGVESAYTAPTLYLRDGAAGAAPAGAAATTQTDTNAAVPAVTVPALQPAETVIVPGLDLQLSRTLLIWLLPVLLLLIAYLIYSERRERHKREQAVAGAPTRSEAGAPLPSVFALKDDPQPQPTSRFQLQAAPQQTVDAYRMDDQLLREEAPIHRGAPGRASRPLPTDPMRQEKPVTGEETPVRRAGREQVAWPAQPDDDYAEEATVTPLRMEDEEVTYRLQAVAQPIIGYLVRATSDPNLPKELPIYGLNAAPGQLRQIHIGRHSKHNTVVINDKSVSREHAVILQRDGRLFLRDNASTAGTFLNWKRLNPGEELLLRHNDLIGFGQIAYEFRTHGEDEATIPHD